MASSTSSGSSHQGDPLLPEMMDTRKRKRMLSNRESARRSRLRKQQHLDDLTAQMSQLNTQNGQILTNVNVTTQLYLNVEAENSILRAQLAELSNHLQALNDIIHCLTAAATESDGESLASFDLGHVLDVDLEFDGDFSMNPWGFPFVNHPVMGAHPNAFMC